MFSFMLHNIMPMLCIFKSHTACIKFKVNMVKKFEKTLHAQILFIWFDFIRGCLVRRMISDGMESVKRIGIWKELEWNVIRIDQVFG